jgi:hypothetical protein
MISIHGNEIDQSTWPVEEAPRMDSETRRFHLPKTLAKQDRKMNDDNATIQTQALPARKWGGHRPHACLRELPLSSMRPSVSLSPRRHPPTLSNSDNMCSS